MNKITTFLFLSAIVVLPTAFVKPLANTGIIVEVTGFRSNKGEMDMYLFKSSDGFPNKPEKAVKNARIKISDNKCVVTFENIPFGTYAISGYHDENNDKKMNSTFYGKPTEGACASNNAKGNMGPPEFDDAKFTFSSPNQKMIIKMEYF